MIVVDLICANEHRFEGWFASHEALEHQRAEGLLSCPSCTSHVVRRLPSAVHVARSGAEALAAEHSPPQTSATPQLDPAELIARLREQAAKSEDVGKRFAEEARRIHYGEAEERAIKGIASREETRRLLEEGISVLPVPPEKEDLH